MDIPRVKPRRDRRPLFAAGALALAVTTVGLVRMRPAGPAIERATLALGMVERGTMVRTVRGDGTLVPEDLRIVSALTAGRVDRVLVHPGTRVDSGTVLLEMSNPDVQLQSLDAERQEKLAEADLASTRASLENERLAAVSSVAAARSELHEAQRGVQVAQRLAAEGLTSAMDIDRARDRADEAQERYGSEEDRLRVLTDSQKAQLELRASEVSRLQAIARFQGERVASMTVRAGQAGVLQSLEPQPGQWVNPGQELARVAGQGHLKAVVRVPEADARDVAIGLSASIDTRNGVVPGHVSRVDPAAQNGTVTVDIAVDGTLPRGTRADLAVDATIVLERLADVLHVARPADASSESDAQVFVLDADRRAATRRTVRFGRGSSDDVVVLAGLRPGEQVILTEMSRFGNTGRVRLQ